MNYSHFLRFISLFCLLSSFVIASDASTSSILAETKKMHAPGSPVPISTFRAGNVTPNPRIEHVFTKTDYGWSIQLPSKAPIPTPTVIDGAVYVSGGFHSKEYFCFDAKTGDLRWRVNLDDDGPSSAVIEDGIAVFNTESCTIFAITAATGKPIWSWWLGDPLTSTPAISKGRVFSSYPASGKAEGGSPPTSHVIICMELKTGKILWQRWIDSDVMSSPVIEDDEVLVTSFGGTIYRFRASNGEILAADKIRATSAPILINGQIIVSKRVEHNDLVSMEGLASFSKDTPAIVSVVEEKKADYLNDKIQKDSKLKGEAMGLDSANGFASGAPAQANAPAAMGNIGQSNVSTMQAFQGSRIAVWEESQYAAMGDELISTKLKDGTRNWAIKLTGDLAKAGGHLAAPPVIVQGRIFLTSLDGQIREFDKIQGKELHSWKIGSAMRTQPAIVDGRIYATTQDGRIICIETGDPSLTGWHTWGADMAHTNRVVKK